MTTIDVGTVDVVVQAREGVAWHVLVLQRSAGTRCPASWEIVHGHIEPGETPEAAAVRELVEETGLVAERLYSVRVQPIYLVRTGTIQMGVGFAAVVGQRGLVTLGPEHVRFEWMSAAAASERLSWPADHAAVREAMFLLRAGDAGAVEDALRVV